MHKKHSPRVLFVLKKRSQLIWTAKDYSSSPGLNNSAQFVSDMLNCNGIQSKVVEVIDNNGIDKEVRHYKPTHVIIEALWVVPSKFHILTKLHPKVTWNIRVHSDIPFMSNEGIAVEWLLEYLKYPHVTISFNKLSAMDAFIKLYDITSPPLKKRIVYLPNYYPLHFKKSSTFTNPYLIRVGCFGAVRPLKNQLIQAMAAVTFAHETGRRLEYHINGTRVEGQAESTIKNIRKLFAALPPHRFRLVEHPWLSHKDFKYLIGLMDIGLQVSFSETFNIVAADFVSMGIPVVTSNEVSWVHPKFHADPTSVEDIVKTMKRAEFWKVWFGFIDFNKVRLRDFSKDSRYEWISWINSKKA